MNKRQVILLWIIALVLCVTVAIVKTGMKPAAAGTTARKPGDTLFASFPAKDIAKVNINGGETSVTLEKKDGKWTVAERDSYPANSSLVNDLIRSINDLKVQRGVEAGPSFAARFGMDESSKKADEHGLTATFADASGKELAKVTLGKNITTGAQDEQAMMMGAGSVGRYIRNHADESGFYATSEMFPSLASEPARWLATDFLNPEKVKSISATGEGKPGIEWKISRESEDAPQYKLDDSKPEEVLNATVAQPLNDVFSYARFDDVLPAADIEAKVDKAKLRTVVIETFEGFTYTITLAPQKAPAPAKEGETAAAPDANTLYATVSVTATIPAERKKEKDEKPEDAKTKDEAFAKRKQQLEDKLTKEKALAGRTFAIAKITAEALLKSRAELTAKAAPAPPNPGAANAMPFPGGAVVTPPGKPGPGIEAVTPPVEVPAGGE